MDCTFVLFFLYCGMVVPQNDFCDNDGDCSKGRPKTLEKYKNLDNPFSAINNLPPLNDPLYLIPQDELPQIIWWFREDHKHEEARRIACSKGSCIATSDRRQLTNKLTRAIIMFGLNFDTFDIPLPRLPHHEWALFIDHSPFQSFIALNQQIISLFNHTASFRRESDMPKLPPNFPKPAEMLSEEFFISTNEKNRLQQKNGLAPVVYMQSNCNVIPSDRDSYVEELMKYIQIDSYGKCLNNKRMPDENEGRHKHSTDQNFKLVAQYKFQLAFENAICPDYMTEKVFRPLKIGCVPVYYGSSTIRDFMPSDKAVIVVTDFKSPKDLADYLKELNEDDDKYNEYLKHRKVGKITNDRLNKVIGEIKKKSGSKQVGRSSFECYLCDKLYERNKNLKEHLNDQTISLLSPKIVNSNHACPLPHKLDKGTGNFVPHQLHQMQKRANTILKMLQANETDHNNFRNYL